MGAKKKKQARPTMRQQRALAILLAGGTNESAAIAAGVSDSTIRRWRKLDVFNQTLVAQENEQLVALSRRLSTAATLAVNLLIEKLEARSDTHQIRAASELLRARKEFGELVTLADRISALEERMAEL